MFASLAIHLIPMLAIASIGLLLSTFTPNSAAAVVGTLMIALLFDLIGILPGTEADGGSALVAAERHAYDVVILDVAMAGLSGIDVCRRLRAGLLLFGGGAALIGALLAALLVTRALRPLYLLSRGVAAIERTASPTQRVEDSAGRPGSGLGLAIVRAIAERHRGTVRVDGATVTITLPRTIDQPDIRRTPTMAADS